MCCTLQPAVLTDTTVYAAEVRHPTEGLVHVVGYQNTAFSKPGQPNAMLLPIPALPGSVTQDNVVNAVGFKGILKEYAEAVTRLEPRRRSMSMNSLRSDGLDEVYGAKGFKVFESGSYTVVLAKSAKYLAEGAKEVPVNKRVAVSQVFANALEAIYPEWPIALCCFEGAVDEAEPLFWWYKPKNPEELLAPAIDAHDGNPPNLSNLVKRDHALAFASSESDRTEDYRLRNAIDYTVPTEHRWLFSARVCGVNLRGVTKNGDFTLPVTRVRRESVGSAHLVGLFT